MDRNNIFLHHTAKNTQSLSARRAWIEIRDVKYKRDQTILSLSARRAWIEIQKLPKSIDKYAGRSPQGERG